MHSKSENITVKESNRSAEMKEYQVNVYHLKIQSKKNSQRGRPTTKENKQQKIKA